MKKSQGILILKILLALGVLALVLSFVQFQDLVIIRETPESGSKILLKGFGRVSALPREELEFRVDDIRENGGAFEAGKTERVAYDAARMSVELGFFSIIRLSDKSLLLPFLLLHFVCYWFSFYRWHALLRGQGIDIKLSESFRIAYIGLLWNNALPSLVGGDLVKAIYVARRTEEKTRAVTTIVIDRILGMAGLTAVAAFGIAFKLGDPQFTKAAWLVGLMILGGALILPIMFSEFARNLILGNSFLKKLPMYGVLLKMAEAFSAYKGRNGFLLWLIFLSSCGNLMWIFTNWGYAQVFGAGDFAMSEAICLIPVAMLVSSIPMAPGGWGLGEFSYGWAFTTAGCTLAVGVVVSILTRLVNTFICGLPGLIFIVTSRSKYKITAEEEAEFSAGTTG